MELRIETQKQTLMAREESLKKLMEMLRSKGVAVRHLEEDQVEKEQLHARVVEEQRRVKQLEKLLELRDSQINTLQEVSYTD